jgi:hypothetical protein
MRIFSSIVSFPSYVIDTSVEICGCSSPQNSSGITSSEDAGDGRDRDSKVDNWITNSYNSGKHRQVKDWRKHNPTKNFF